MAFEKFTRVSTRGFQPKVSLRARGHIGFNQGSVRRFKMVQYKFATLAYDRENRLIAVHLTNDENEDGILKLRVKESDAAIPAKAFFDYFDINCSKTVRTDASWDEEMGAIIIKVPPCKEEEGGDSNL